MAADSGPIIGIDLGTTNSLVAIADASGPRILPDGNGRALCPSVVHYPADAALPPLIGDAAAASETAGTTIASVKRLMGRSLADARGDFDYLAYPVVEGPNASLRIPLSPDGARLVSPQEVSAAILAHLKRQAEAALGCVIQRAVVTVPAYFDDAQRQATREAGRFAGLEVVRIVNEPTAAALAYGLGSGQTLADARERVVAVYDLGGGTFDISILKISPPAEAGETAFFQVLATAGDTHLGGDDFDHAIMQAIAAAHGPFPDDARLTARLAQAARALKHRLDASESARVEVDLGQGPTTVEFTAAQLRAIAEPLIERTMVACRRALADAGSRLDGSGLDAVILVGGATRMPLVRERVAAFFGLEPYTGVDPDQVVALGAAVQGRLLESRSGAALLLDVIPLSLGIETVGGAVAKLIMRNSTVPARATEMFSTSVDGQTAIKLHVLQGEREMVADCRSLGTFSLAIPPMPAGLPQVEVEFLVDANGVLRVSAMERRSGRRAAIQIAPNHGLTPEEVSRIERESLLHAREDMARHRIVDLITSTRLDLRWIRDRFERFGQQLDPARRSQLATKLEDVEAMVVQAERDWTSVNADAMQHAKEALDRASLRLQEIAIVESLRQEAADASGQRRG